MIYSIPFMKIGVIGTIWLNTPPTTYGGTEEVVDNLVNTLVDIGHDVTLFAPKTAKTKAKLFPTVDKPLYEQHIPWTNISQTLFHITEAFDHAGEFDILHVHLNLVQDYIALPLAALSPTPVLFTFHFLLPQEQTQPDRLQLLLKYKHLPFISISDSQRAGLPLNFVATVYNGISIDNYPFSSTSDDYFVWLGKVNPLKGTKQAIEVAKKAGVKLYVLGAVDKEDKDKLYYYEHEIKPLIDGKQIIWVGSVSIEEKAKFLGKAKALLNPIQWKEPFGLVMSESLAVGTPVIANAKGAATEIIQDGKTGFLVETEEEMVEKIKEVGKLNRNACRKRVEDYFSAEKMTEGYLAAYKKTVANWDTYIKNQKK